METQIYLWIGRIAVWLSFGIISFKILGWLLEEFINWLGKRYNNMWIVIEYAFYRHKFKKWIKDKERHPKMKKH